MTLDSVHEGRLIMHAVCHSDIVSVTLTLCVIEHDA